MSDEHGGEMDHDELPRVEVEIEVQRGAAFDYLLSKCCTVMANDERPPTFCLRFEELPFAVMLSKSMAEQIADAIGLLLREEGRTHLN